MNRTIKRMLSSILFIAISVWLLLSLLLYFFQQHYIYYPYKKLDITPAQNGLAFEDVTLTTSDDVQIHGWWIPHPEARHTLLFFHGNAGNISHRLPSIDIFHQLKLSVFIIDYRGYGNSEGKPGEQGTYHDADAAWQYLVKNKGLKPEQIILFGRSLGGAVASWLAVKYEPAAVILESTFTSVADMGRHYYPYLPVKLINHIKYNNLKRVPAIRAPLLIVHSRDDDIVPFKLGQAIFDAARAPKQFLEIKGDHNYGHQQTGQAYIDGLASFINSVDIE